MKSRAGNSSPQRPGKAELPTAARTTAISTGRSGVSVACSQKRLKSFRNVSYSFKSRRSRSKYVAKSSVKNASSDIAGHLAVHQLRPLPMMSRNILGMYRLGSPPSTNRTVRLARLE